MQGGYDPFSDFDLRSPLGSILRCGSDQSVQIRFLNDVIIVHYVVLEPKVRELLHDMRASSTKANNCHSTACECRFGFRP